MLKCYIYGAGGEYQRLASYLSLYREAIKILGIVTTQKPEFNFLDGVPCIQPKEMQITEMDYVIIAVKNWKEIYEYLRKMKIEDDKILRSHVFYLPYFDLEGYLDLKRSHVSILANSCMGGLVYTSLGLKTLSPTINASCPNETFIDFLQHYKYYLSMDMKVCEECYSNTYNRERFRPTGSIDNKIIWHFPHTINAREAVSKWNQKREQVNYDNIAALMIIYTDKDAVEFEKLPIKKKIGFYYEDFHLKSVLYCAEWKKEEVRFQYDFLWNRYVLDSLNCIDWIKFLNGRDDFLRYKNG